MGLDNPDTLYFGARISDDAEYVVTGRRGTTADLSFQILNGSYTATTVPGSVTAFDDRAFTIAPDGIVRDHVRSRAGGRPTRLLPHPDRGSVQLVVREVYSDWSQTRGTIAIAQSNADRPCRAHARLRQTGGSARAGKGLVARVQTWLQFPSGST